MYSKHCIACGAELVEGASFCASCGAPVQTEAPGSTPDVDTGPSRCPSCGAEVAEGTSFCANCGAPVEAEAPTPTTPSGYCSACGAALPAGASFCGSCGAAVPARAPVPPWAAPPGVLVPRKAGFWQRAIAVGFIDFFIIWLIVLRLVFVVTAVVFASIAEAPDELWILGQEEPYRVSDGCEPNLFAPVCFGYYDWDAGDTANTIWMTFNYIWLAIPFFYLWLGNARGRTLGKRLTGVRVIRKDSGQPLGVWRGFVRTVGFFLLGGPFCLGYLWSIWDKDKQTWHDKIAGSVVVGGEAAPEIGEVDIGRELVTRRRLDDMKAELTPEEALRFDMALHGRLKDTGTMTLMAAIGFVCIPGIHRFMLGQAGMGILYLLTGGLCYIGTIVDMVRMSSMVTEYNLRIEYDELTRLLAAKTMRQRRPARQGPP